jgi:flagellar hook-associated protein 1 FlgK
LGADLFSIGRSSLNTSKKSLATTSHNIANANTEGFSRQRITTETNTPVGEGKHVFGTGVNVQSVKRVHDKLVEKKLNSSITDHGYHDGRTFELSRVEEVFNEINSEGLNKILNRFFNSFRELANQPENETVRAIVRENAKLVVTDFKRVNNALQEAQVSINKKIDATVVDINSMAHSISSLNKEITRLEVMGGETGDLRDQRDMAVRNLSEYFKLNTYEDEKGQYVVNIKGVGSLVAGGRHNQLKAGFVVPKNAGAQSEGKMEIFFEAKRNHPITSNIKSGKLGAMIRTRDEDLVELRAQIDEVAHGLIMSTNAIHRRGYANKSIMTDQNGNIIDNGRQGKLTGIDFFKVPPNGRHRSSEYIDLSNDVKEDLNNISTGLAPNSPGDNRIAIAISKLQHEKILSGGTTSFEEAYLKAVGKVGLRTSKSKIDAEQASGILAQAKSIKERISGVSIDEETANMVRYQHAYDASAKMIKTADEMFDSVLGMMR